MQPALPSPMPDASPAVFAVNGGKPHQGVASKNPGLHQRIVACNSTTALGVSWGLWSGTASGARVSYEYDAFGNVINSTGTTPNEFLYRGEQYDSDLGLYYLRARYYNPLTGRFMSRDPEDGNIKIPATLHKYLYAAADPVDRIDPTGHINMLEFSLLANVAFQRTIVVVVPAAKAACVGLKAVDYALTLWSLKNSMMTGEIEPPEARDMLIQRAEEDCDLFFPEK